MTAATVRHSPHAGLRTEGVMARSPACGVRCVTVVDLSAANSTRMMRSRPRLSVPLLFRATLPHGSLPQLTAQDPVTAGIPEERILQFLPGDGLA